MRPLVLDGPRGSLSQLAFVPLAPLVGVHQNRCFTTPHDGRWRRSRDSHGRLGLVHSDRVVGSRESDDSQNGARLVAVASVNLGGSGHCEWSDTCTSGQREEAKGGTRRRMIKVFRWCVSSNPWDQCERRGLNFWCARARRLVYSAAQRARRAVSSLAQWQRPRMWIYVAAPYHTTKPSWGGDAH